MHRSSARILAGPLLLTGIFSLAACNVGAFTVPLALLVLAYTLAATFCFLLPRAAAGTPHAADFAAMLLLWLPLEFSAGASLVPRPVQGYLHAVAYGVAIVLALWLFLIGRALKGIKYQPPAPPRGSAQSAARLRGPAAAAGDARVPGRLSNCRTRRTSRGPRSARAISTIFCATALPEEILFRGLMQNWLMQRFGATNLTLLASGIIFGCAHLNNGPLAFPNWR